MRAFVGCKSAALCDTERDIIALSMEVWLSVWPEVTLRRWQPPIISLNVLTGRGCTPRRPPTPPLPAIHQMLPLLNYRASKLPESKLMMHKVCNCDRPNCIQDGLRYEYSTTEVIKRWCVIILGTGMYNVAIWFICGNKSFRTFSSVLTSSLTFQQRIIALNLSGLTVEVQMRVSLRSRVYTKSPNLFCVTLKRRAGLFS
jgi:hypothetical protein